VPALSTGEHEGGSYPHLRLADSSVAGGVWHAEAVSNPFSMIVVGAAILDGRGRVLAAQRGEPPALAGGWEFPGGKVEPGETEPAAVVRECREELGVGVEVGRRLGPDIPLSEGRGVLRVWLARLAEGEPRALEHQQLRWLDATELDDVAWLPADAPLIDELRAYLVSA
jgi:8-oxo-dGTP diphosphatase